jgi:cyclopropane fatty-acyl-phospholipid synthase-like methyltransferase
VSGARSGFDWLARPYRALEFIAFGRGLERARFAFLDRLAGSRDILLLGEGDGRCAARLARMAPGARILCVDSSAGMIRRASARIAPADAARVTFLCADALSFAPEPGAFDAVATLFFLDCFDEAGVEAIVARAGPGLRPGATWLFADFVLPGRGAARLRARAWLAVLYAFFRAGAGLRASSLPPSERVLERAGWTRASCRDFQGGLVRSAVYLRPGPTAAPAASA